MKPKLPRPQLPQGRVTRALSLAKVGARAGLSWATERGTEAAAKHSAEVLGNLRGLAAKVGQTASYVDGLIPPDKREVYEKALQKLQANTPSSSPEQITALLKQEYGKDLTDVFQSFDSVPRNSASIGQVHRAVLFDGTAVAVKIQHPGIHEAVESDLSNIAMLESVIDLAGPRGMKAGPILEEVLGRFRDELNYEKEAQNQESFRRFHEAHPLIHIPRVNLELSTRRILVSEWVDGTSLSEAAEAETSLRESYARTLWNFVFRGNLVGGAFNADPHPGNYLFHPDGKITFLDFGCVQPIDDRIRIEAVVAHQAALRADRPGFDRAVSRMLGTKGGTYGEATKLYTTRCFEPLFQPSFRITPAYAAALFHEVKTLKAQMSAKDKSFTPPPPQLALMNRLQFGFYSVLSRLNVEVSYQDVEREFLEEAEATKTGLLGY